MSPCYQKRGREGSSQSPTASQLFPCESARLSTSQYPYLVGEALFLSAYKSGLAATSWDLPSSWNIILCVIVPFLPVLMYISDTIALRYATVHERIGETEVRGRTEGEGMWERERNLLIFAMTQAGGLWGGAFVRVAR